MQVSFAHSWEEDEGELRLRVPLGTAPRASLDVYGAPRELPGPLRLHLADCAAPACAAVTAVSDVLVKVYAPGRQLLLDLLHPVNDATARIQVAQEDVRITLRKARAGHAPHRARARRRVLTRRTLRRVRSASRGCGAS